MSSLSEQLATFFSPAPRPDVDPEAMDTADGAATALHRNRRLRSLPSSSSLADFDEDSDANDASAADTLVPVHRTSDADLTAGDRRLARERRSRAERSQQLRLRPDIPLDDLKYASRRTSRSALLEDEAAAGAAADGDDGGDNQYEEQEVVTELAHRSKRARVRETHADEPTQNGYGSDADHSDSDDDDDDARERPQSDEEVGSDEVDAVGGKKSVLVDVGRTLRAKAMEEADALQEQLEQVAAAGASDVTVLDRRASALELERANHTRAQRALWDSVLDARIRMQRLLNTANRLPTPDDYKLFCANSAEIPPARAAASSSLRGLLHELVTMQGDLYARNPALAALTQADEWTALTRASDPADATPTDELWDALAAQQAHADQQHMEILDRWSAKVNLLSTSATKQKLSALNQPLSVQINQLLGADRPRLLRRVHVRRSQSSVLGKRERTDEQAPHVSSDQHSGAHKHSPPVDEEIFDDTDFYQQLLKEVIESGSAGDDPIALSRAALKLKQQRRAAETKKQVDRRASKGRRIRYVVHDKMVNFTTPIEHQLPPYADELFAALFRSG